MARDIQFQSLPEPYTPVPPVPPAPTPTPIVPPPPPVEDPPPPSSPGVPVYTPPVGSSLAATRMGDWLASGSREGIGTGVPGARTRGLSTAVESTRRR
jgi:hypothetical protein